MRDVATLEEEIRELRAALVNTADTAERALGMVIDMQALVDAAVNWSKEPDETWKLHDAVKAYLKTVEKRPRS